MVFFVGQSCASWLVRNDANCNCWRSNIDNGEKPALIIPNKLKYMGMNGTNYNLYEDQCGHRGWQCISFRRQTASVMSLKKCQRHSAAKKRRNKNTHLTIVEHQKVVKVSLCCGSPQQRILATTLFSYLGGPRLAGMQLTIFLVQLLGFPISQDGFFFIPQVPDGEPSDVAVWTHPKVDLITT